MIYRVDRTTRMLLIILCVFLITELPQGIMMVLSGILPEPFRRHIYNSLGDLLDLLSLCNACTTFVIYCSMSEQFRNVRLLFKICNIYIYIINQLSHTETGSDC